MSILDPRAARAPWISSRGAEAAAWAAIDDAAVGVSWDQARSRAPLATGATSRLNLEGIAQSCRVCSVRVDCAR